MMKRFITVISLCFLITSISVAQPAKKVDELYAQAIGLAKQEKVQEALTAFNNIIKKYPTYEKAYTQAGYILMRTQKKEEALACFKQSIKLKKDNIEVFYTLGMLYKNGFGKADSALYFFKKTKQYFADTSSEANYNIAWCFNALQKYDSAIVYLKKAFSINNNYKPAYREIAFSYHATKKYEDAIEQFKKCVAVSKVDLAYYYMGLCYMELNNKTKALEQYLELKSINEKMAESLLKKIEAKEKENVNKPN